MRSENGGYAGMMAFFSGKMMINPGFVGILLTKPYTYGL
jgi:hypothetical protein